MIFLIKVQVPGLYLLSCSLLLVLKNNMVDRRFLLSTSIPCDAQTWVVIGIFCICIDSEVCSVLQLYDDVVSFYWVGFSRSCVDCFSRLNVRQMFRDDLSKPMGISIQLDKLSSQSSEPSISNTAKKVTFTQCPIVPAMKWTRVWFKSEPVFRPARFVRKDILKLDKKGTEPLAFPCALFYNTMIGSWNSGASSASA